MPTPLAIFEAAQVALDSGVAVVSALTPSLSATYSINDEDQRKMMAVAAYVGITNRFPAGRATWQVRDMLGLPRTFSSTAQFMAFALALTDYAAQLYMLIDGVGGQTQLPAQPVNIP